MMDTRQRQDLDNHITGHYGEDQFRDEDRREFWPMTSVHREYWERHHLADVYEYCPADDGPECEIITRILARYPLYIPGMERRTLLSSRMLDIAAVVQFSQPFKDLTENQRTLVRNHVARAYLAQGLA
jgi:hypothetical protein